jgi:hypothetical protein
VLFGTRGSGSMGTEAEVLTKTQARGDACLVSVTAGLLALQARPRAFEHLVRGEGSLARPVRRPRSPCVHSLGLYPRVCRRRFLRTAARVRLSRIGLPQLPPGCRGINPTDR